jgi:small conductance mechanosensitive channel
METWLHPKFWQEVMSNTLQWFITTAPSMLIIIVLAGVMLKAINLSLPRLKSLMIRRSEEGGAASVNELEKRIQTLLGIVRTLAKALVWSMAILLLLRKCGVDVAPLIAGVGIAGLAVGFGAQELVRDVISGFFILLENQVRTGDVAVINGTGGLVESMNLRTITLRDLSGVVHVFQNGKINTLSNMTKGWSAMVFDIGVAYKEDTDQVANTMREVAE